VVKPGRAFRIRLKGCLWSSVSSEADSCGEQLHLVGSLERLEIRDEDLELVVVEVVVWA
jgi:hypothetical protein